MDWREWFFTVPLGTRSLMVASTVAFVLSPFFPTAVDYLACSPYHVLMKLQVWPGRAGDEEFRRCGKSTAGRRCSSGGLARQRHETAQSADPPS